MKCEIWKKGHQGSFWESFPKVSSPTVGGQTENYPKSSVSRLGTPSFANLCRAENSCPKNRQKSPFWAKKMSEMQKKFGLKRRTEKILGGSQIPPPELVWNPPGRWRVVVWIALLVQGGDGWHPPPLTRTPCFIEPCPCLPLIHTAEERCVPSAGSGIGGSPGVRLQRQNGTVERQKRGQRRRWVAGLYDGKPPAL